ncbi:MAG: dGTP triphosphohydrolase [Verrucomicrobiales bacterium]
MENQFYQAFDGERLQPGGAGTDDSRTPFEVDRDRVIHSSAFRRLQSKTQVFLAGEYDFYRTRLTHSIEVAQIGRSICRHLQRVSPLLGDNYHIDSDLVEAICLAHDLGHPPFGHAGERTLNRLMEKHGGFEGNAQTLRLLTNTIYQGRRGMNPTRAFLDGVLKYKTLRRELMDSVSAAPENHFLYDEQAETLGFVMGGREFPAAAVPGSARDAVRSIECQVMDWADDTAYSIHDIVDGIHAGFLGSTAIEKWATEKSLAGTAGKVIENLLQAIRDGKAEPRMERRIGDFIRSVTLVERPGHLADLTNRHRYALELDPDILVECRTYKKLAFERVFLTHQLKQLEYKGERMLTEVFAIFAGQYLDREEPSFNLLPPDTSALLQSEAGTSRRARVLCDYLAGMTDGFASRTCRRLTDPDFGSIVDLV